MIVTENTRIRMLTSIAGLAMPGSLIQAEFSHPAGSIIDVHPEAAKAWIACGHAEAVPVPPAPAWKAK